MDNTRRTLISIICSALVALLVGVIWQLATNSERLGEDSAEATRTALNQTEVAVTATAAILPTATPLPTQPSAEATPSNYDLLLRLANEAPLVAYEPFDDNRRGWSAGGNGLFSRGERVIRDGSYRWELTAVEGFYWWTAPINAPFDNFYAEATFDKQDRNVGDSGLIFRYDDGDNYYEFSLCDDVTQYRVYKETSGTRTSLVACVEHPAINPDERNRLAVIAQTDRYLLFINDQHVNTIEDSDHLRGEIGVGIDLDEGQANVFEFDDVVVRSADLDR